MVTESASDAIPLFLKVQAGKELVSQVKGVQSE